MRECINISSDIPANIEESVEEFKKLIPQLDDSELDAYHDKLHYWIEDFNADLIAKVKPNIVPDESDPCGTNAYRLVVNEALKLENHYRFETRWSIYDRSERAKKFTKQYIQSNQIPK